MPFDIGEFGQTVASGAVGGLLGLALEKHNDARQINQQQKLTDIQAKANREQAQYSQQLQLDTWNKTNYEAQMQHLKNAGLNPGLLYGMGGGGGQTTGSASAQGVSSGNAPSGGREIMDLSAQAMQTQLIAAQTENIKADTANKQAEHPNITKTGGEIDARIEILKQNAKTEQAKQFLTEAQTTMQNLQNEITGKTKEDQINGIINGYLKLDQERQALVKQNAMTDQTWNDVRKIYTAKAIEGFLQNALTEAQTATQGSQKKMLDAETLAIPQKLSNDFYKISGEQELQQITQKIQTDDRLQQQLDNIGISKDDFTKLLQGLGLYYGLKGSGRVEVPGFRAKY